MTTHAQHPAAITARIETDSPPDPHAEPATVWVLRRWDWHEDNDITVHSSQDRGLASLAEYVKRSWSNIVHHEDIPAVPPTDPRDAIQHYYGPDGYRRAEEGYSLHEKQIDNPAPTQACRDAKKAKQ